MTRVLIVEDEPRLRKDLADFLELTGFVPEGVGTAQELRQALAHGSTPAVIILDVGLPDGNGFELAAEIRQSHACGIIMLTALGDSDDRIRGFESGADLYMVKHSTLREIEAAIRSLLRRMAERPSRVDEAADQWVLESVNWQLIAPNHRACKLTATEFAFMRTLCSRPGDICPRDELVETLARPRATFDNRHLDAIVSRLRRKLEEQIGLPAPIRVVYGVGYTFTAPVMMQ